MIVAQRFSSVGWVAGVAVAALGCYLVSQTVATERAALAKVDHQIAAAREDVRRLRMEIGARSRMSQLDRWNTQVLALQAPRARQFVGSEVQLASLNAPAPLPLDPAIAPSPAAARQVAYAPAPVPTPVGVPEPMLRPATYLKPPVDRIVPDAAPALVKVAAVKPAAAPSLLPADIGSLAAGEASPKAPRP